MLSASVIFVSDLSSAVQAQRHLLADQANAEDQAMYEAKQAQLDQDIQRANAELDRSKAVLQAARQDKKRKLQYEVTEAQQ